MAAHRGERFFRSTRGRIISLLRRKRSTVNDLAAALAVTDNAIRAQLIALERDGLVVDTGTSPGTRKPHVVYSLTNAAEAMFPKAYEPLLGALLSVLGHRLSPRRMDGVLRAVGKRLAATIKPAPATATTRQRAELALRVLGDLGGLAEIEDQDGKLMIRGLSCPLRTAVSAYPGTCRAAESMLSEIVGVPVRECCEKGDTPRCCFEIAAG